MRFTVIQGGKSCISAAASLDPLNVPTPPGRESQMSSLSGPSPSDVRDEALRRRSEAGVERARHRRSLGLATEPATLYLGLQIDFVAEKLVSLDPVPEDYRSDSYWPSA